MVLVGGGVRAGYQDIIQVNKKKGQTPQNTVHKTLKGLGTVLQAKWHPDKLKKAEWSGDGGLGDMLRGHGDLVVPPDKVHHGKDGGAGGHRREGVDMRERVPVMACGSVEAPVVTAGTPPTVGFGHDV